MIRRLAYATLFYAILLTGLLYNAEERYTALWNRHGVDLAEQQVLLFGLGAAFGIGIVVSIFNNINSIDLSPDPRRKGGTEAVAPLHVGSADIRLGIRCIPPCC